MVLKNLKKITLPASLCREDNSNKSLSWISDDYFDDES